MQDQSDKGKATATRSRLVDPTKAAFAAAVFAVSVGMVGCGPRASNDPYCPENPTVQQLQAMSDAKARECLEEADREGRSSTYRSYHNHYSGRGFSYTQGSYPTTTSSGGSRFVAPSSGGYSSGSSYKSGSGGTFSGSSSHGSGSAIS